MDAFYAIFQIINSVLFVLTFCAAMWRHHRGGDWQYPGFLALVFLVGSTGGPR